MIDLFLKNTQPNKPLKDAFGKEGYESLRLEVMKDKHYTCQCCGWEGAKEIENREHLVLHVTEFNQDEPSKSKILLVCKSCYIINHVEVGAKMNYIKFVNSIYSQKDLTKISWSDCSKKIINNNNREKAINDKKIIPLKKEPEFYLNQIREGRASQQLKVIFSDKFLISG